MIAKKDYNSFPLPQDKLLLFDLDQTLIDQSYDLTSDEVQALSGEAEQLGWRLGLSSDTPRAGMEYWQDRLGFHGPLVIEKGAAIVSNGQELACSEDMRWFGELPHIVTPKMQDNFDAVWLGDPTSAIRERAIVGSPGDEIVMINMLRRHSFSLYAGVVDAGGRFMPQPTPLDRAVRIVRDSYQLGARVDEDVNHDYGIMILHDVRTRKRLGTQALLRTLHLSSIGMVGNSYADFVGDDIALHYAVSNATPEFRSVADYISTDSLTSGCVEILRKILHQA